MLTVVVRLVIRVVVSTRLETASVPPTPVSPLDQALAGGSVI